ncbi:MAG: TraX family protein [Lachnospiraceae bacterium]
MGINSFQLKCIAILTMMIDHIGAIFFPEYLIFRYIGRIAFPIFCFLLVEGFFYTRDIRKYLFRLGLFALISEIPYDLAFRGVVLEFEKQNVFFTLFIGVMMMYALEQCSEWPVKIVEVILSMWFAVFLCTDYSFKGILLIAIYYFFRKYKWLKLGLGAVWSLLWGEIQRYGIAATILLAAYNGERGRPVKYFFYVFYPLHLLVLYLIFCILSV